MRQYKHQSNKNRKNLMKMYRKQHTRQEVYWEALHNSRGSITQVAILIATVTYTSGINPPSVVYQDGPLRGTAVAARRMPFKVFTICNNAALFTSLCIVVVLISIIPFRRRPLMAMLMATHKAMWVAIGFLAAAYFAAALVLMPSPAHGSRMDWTIVSLLTISAGTLGSVFVGLGIMLARHHCKKIRHYRKKMSGDHSGHHDQDVKTDRNSDIFEGDENNTGKNWEEESINSDMDISMIEGHHPF